MGLEMTAIPVKCDEEQASWDEQVDDDMLASIITCPLSSVFPPMINYYKLLSFHLICFIMYFQSVGYVLSSTVFLNNSAPPAASKQIISPLFFCTPKTTFFTFFLSLSSVLVCNQNQFSVHFHTTRAVATGKSQ